jgi:hypothetical protein
MASGGNTVVEQSAHNPKIKGSNLAGTGTNGQYYKTFYSRNL